MRNQGGMRRPAVQSNPKSESQKGERFERPPTKDPQLTKKLYFPRVREFAGDPVAVYVSITRHYANALCPEPSLHALRN
jgi:hypothetical protein